MGGCCCGPADNFGDLQPSTIKISVNEKSHVSHTNNFSVEAGGGGDMSEAALLAELEEMEGGPKKDPAVRAQELLQEAKQKKA